MTTRIMKSPPPAGASRTRPSAIALIIAAVVVLSVIAAVIITSGGGTAGETSGLREAAAALAPVTASPPVTVLLVGSPEQAVELQRNAAQLSPEGIGPGMEIVVAASADEVSRARATVNALRLKHGVASVSVFDLRGNGALPLDGGASTCGTGLPQAPAFDAC